MTELKNEGIKAGGYGIEIFTLSGARHIIGNVYLIINNIKYVENPFGIVQLEDGKITLIGIAIGSKTIELNSDNVEFSYKPNEELIEFYKETIKKYAELEVKENAKKAGIILQDKKVVDISPFKRGA